MRTLCDTVQVFCYAAWRLAWRVAVVLALVVAKGASAAGDGGEAALKAAYLFNFALYTEWPALPFAFEFCIAGKGDFGEALNAIARKQISGRPVRIRQLQTGDVPGECNLVFILAGNQAAASQIFAALAGRPVLTVGDVGLELEHPPMLQLSSEDGQLYFSVNQSAARVVGLTFSSKMLRLARGVH